MTGLVHAITKSKAELLQAMGCQRAIAQKVINKGADYLLAVKGNQPKLEEAFQSLLPDGDVSALRH